MLDEEDQFTPDISLDSGDIKLDTGDEHYVNSSLKPTPLENPLTESSVSVSPLQEESGLESIIKTGFVAYERMPMLENIFDRFIRFWTSTLRSFTNDDVDVELKSMQSLRFGSYIDDVPKKTVFAIFKAKEWNNLGLLVLDTDLTYVITDILMGGQSSFQRESSDDRQPTALERTLIDKLVMLVLADLSEAFSPVGDVSLSFERVELSANFAVITRPLNAVIATQFSIEINGQRGNLSVVIPYATLEPVRDKLSQQFLGESVGHDSVWEDHLIKEIMETNVTISTVFEEAFIPLSKILSLQKGSVLKLPHKKEAPYRVRLECDGKPMFYGTLGKIKDTQVVRIDQRLIPPADDFKTIEDFGVLSQQFVPQ
ncbi:flagellar motor switch protein FliM (plasmid) [Aristophania vespae]|uniref:Flagellar motor switch protein FliM n=1 Tax=Aristophania vespae TaxID=2697033 RepID=A0A6P1NNS8_9PROT|nr:flagellar motor switch protein FliM [Aristophania vespae]QHI96511.1 flagellar motor switch protein FliM [Aristophania vespae]UMM64803.1 hypothetical protein DM15PD_18230 [Aristophania vespae]